MMQQTARSGEKAPLFGGRKPLFTQSQLLKLTWPLLVEQFLAVTVGMADTMMVSRCGEAAISGVSLVGQWQALRPCRWRCRYCRQWRRCDSPRFWRSPDLSLIHIFYRPDAAKIRR